MRNLCWLAIPFSLAVFIAVCLLPEGLLIPAAVLCALLLPAALPLRGYSRRKVILAALGLCLGLLWTGCYSSLFRAPAHAMAGDDVLVWSMTVTDYPTETSQGVSLPVLLRDRGGKQVKVLLYAGADASDLRPGDVIRTPVRLARSDVIRGEHTDYYDSKGIYLLGYAQGEVLLAERKDNIPIRFWPQAAAHALKEGIRRSFPKDVSPFLLALTTGDKSSLDDGLYAAFQRSGIAHIVAVSGLHISFLAGLFSLLVGRRSRLTATLGMALVFSFVLLTGSSPSALRAAFMVSAVLLAPLVGREEDRPTTLAFILALLLLFCPFAAADVSLQLSFAAVAGIHMLSGPLFTFWVKRFPLPQSLPGRKQLKKVLDFVFGTLSVTLGALLFTTPLTAYHFRSLSLMGPITNLLVLWVVPLLFLGGLLTAFLSLLLPVPAALLGEIIAWPARYVLWLARTVGRLPFSALSLQSSVLAGWLIAAYAMVLLWLRFRKSVRPAIPLAAIAGTLAAAVLFHALPIRTGLLSVTALDVGQGASTLLLSGSASVLVDCGGCGSADPGDVAADFLQSLGKSKLDALILTHYHTDHAGGVRQLLSRVEVDRILMPDVEPGDPLRRELLLLAEEYNCEVLLLSKDTELPFGKATLSVFAPLGDGGANEEGLSMLCSAGDFDVLITGDMNDIIEQRLVKYKNLPDIELLMVGHHGSGSSTSEELLQATTPETAIISCGYNTYGHPASETLERLGAAGCDIYRTDLMGSVTIIVK